MTRVLAEMAFSVASARMPRGSAGFWSLCASINPQIWPVISVHGIGPLPTTTALEIASHAPIYAAIEVIGYS